MRVHLSTATAVCAALLLTGCGIKGPLTLPPPVTPAKIAPTSGVDHNKPPSKQSASQ